MCSCFVSEYFMFWSCQWSLYWFCTTTSMCVLVMSQPSIHTHLHGGNIIFLDVFQSCSDPECLSTAMPCGYNHRLGYHSLSLSLSLSLWGNKQSARRPRPGRHLQIGQTSSHRYERKPHWHHICVCGEDWEPTTIWRTCCILKCVFYIFLSHISKFGHICDLPNDVTSDIKA